MIKTLEIRRDGVVLCTCVGEEQFPDEDTIRSMKASGHKLYMDGKIYKPDKKARNKDESEG